MRLSDTIRAATLWIACLTGLIALWASASAMSHSQLLPGPGEAFAVLGAAPRTFVEQTARTAGMAALGLSIAALCAGAFVCVVGIFPALEQVFYPPTVILKAAPAVAFAPLLSKIFYSGPIVKIIVAAMISFFPMLVSALDARRRVPDGMILTAEAYGVSRLRFFRHIVAPWALSGFLTGLKTAAPLAVVGAIVGEFVDASELGQEGIGVYIASHARGLYMEHVCAGVIAASALGLLFFAVASALSAVAEHELNFSR